ncbi:tyrosine-type recombinase/integrase, partial [Parabacteroides distasonis]|uniref:tyrosine-type recombinase/integrase n=1 Tax=Parabacteroides distasonis TaxID=823 RepID=UPI001FF095A9
TWQNAETKLISNGLRFIFTCPLFLAQPITFHVARHSYATSVCLANGVSIENVAKMLGHSNIKMTQHYARVLDSSILRDMNNVKNIMSKVMR